MASKFPRFQSNQHWMCWTNKSMEAPPCDLQDLKDQLLTSCFQIPQHTFRALVESMLFFFHKFSLGQFPPSGQLSHITKQLPTIEGEGYVCFHRGSLTTASFWNAAHAMLGGDVIHTEESNICLPNVGQWLPSWPLWEHRECCSFGLSATDVCDIIRIRILQSLRSPDDRGRTLFCCATREPPCYSFLQVPLTLSTQTSLSNQL